MDNQTSQHPQPHSADCIFCKIATGQIPVEPVYETQDVIAFNDLSPQAPVHVLVIPKAHYASIDDQMPSNLMASVFEGAVQVARIKGVADKGYRLITNCGSDAGQTVFHMHVHVLGGTKLSEGMV